MLTSQEPKYDAIGGKIVNRATGVPIPDTEPVFILRAKDRNAVLALRAYASICINGDHRAIVKSRILDFEAFAATNPDLMKEPDGAIRDLAAANVGRAPFVPPPPPFSDDKLQAAGAGVPSVQRVDGEPFPDGSAI